MGGVALEEKKNGKSEFFLFIFFYSLSRLSHSSLAHAPLASLRFNSTSQLSFVDSRYSWCTRNEHPRSPSLAKQRIEEAIREPASSSSLSIDRPQQQLQLHLHPQRHHHVGQARPLPARPLHLALRQGRLLRRRLHAVHRREHRRDRGVPRGRRTSRGADEPVALKFFFRVFWGGGSLSSSFFLFFLSLLAFLIDRKGELLFLTDGSKQLQKKQSNSGRWEARRSSKMRSRPASAS